MATVWESDWVGARCDLCLHDGVQACGEERVDTEAAPLDMQSHAVGPVSDGSMKASKSHATLFTATQAWMLGCALARTIRHLRPDNSDPEILSADTHRGLGYLRSVRHREQNLGALARKETPASSENLGLCGGAWHWRLSAQAESYFTGVCQQRRRDLRGREEQGRAGGSTPRFSLTTPRPGKAQAPDSHPRASSLPVCLRNTSQDPGPYWAKQMSDTIEILTCYERCDCPTKSLDC